MRRQPHGRGQGAAVSHCNHGLKRQHTTREVHHGVALAVRRCECGKTRVTTYFPSGATGVWSRRWQAELPSREEILALGEHTARFAAQDAAQQKLDAAVTEASAAYHADPDNVGPFDDYVAEWAAKDGSRPATRGA